MVYRRRANQCITQGTFKQLDNKSLKVPADDDDQDNAECSGGQDYI